MLVSKLQDLKYLSTFHAEYVALSYYMRDLVPMETLVNEVEISVEHDTKRLEFSTH